MMAKCGTKEHQPWSLSVSIQKEKERKKQCGSAEFSKTFPPPAGVASCSFLGIPPRFGVNFSFDTCKRTMET